VFLLYHVSFFVALCVSDNNNNNNNSRTECFLLLFFLLQTQTYINSKRNTTRRRPVSKGGDTRSRKLYQKLSPMRVTKIVLFDWSAVFKSFWY